MIQITRLVVSIFISQVVGVIASLITIPSVEGWYRTIRKPSFTPPNGVFGPVWTLLYLLMGISLYLIWNKKEHENTSPAVKIQARRAITVFGVQLSLNALWPFLFFGLKSPLYGLIDIVLLWLAIIGTIALFAPISVAAAVLLIPYLLWVSFAAVLNYYIWSLNRN
jgi:benzodiazapine receptor